MIGFTYNAIHSNSFNIIAKSVNRPLLPVLRKRELTIPGKHGVYQFGDETFEKRTIEIEMKYIGTSFEELRTRARSIAVWLNGFNGSQQLIFDDEPDKYYSAKIYSEIGLSNLFKTGEARIILECDPFAYALENTGYFHTWTAGFTWTSSHTWGQEYTFTITANTTATITNVGTFTARPSFIITGSFGDLTMTFGTATLSYNETVTSSQTLTIDCENYTALLGTTNKLSVISGSASTDFFEFTTGSNTVIFSGTSANFTVTIDFAPRYL